MRLESSARPLALPSLRLESSARPLALPSLLLGALLTAGCSHPTSSGPHPAGPPPPPGPEVLQEIEINDSPYAPDFIGGLDSASHLIIEGFVQGPGGLDRYDHFGFYAIEPLTVEFVLHGLAPGDDLDLCLWDPVTESIIACWNTPWNPEEGGFTIDHAGQEFVLLVESFLYDSDYDLEIITYPYSSPASDGSDDSSAPPAPTGPPGSPAALEL